MTPTYIKIDGVPYGQAKARGDLNAPVKWTEAIISQTRSLPKVKEACIVKLTFLLPLDKFPKDYPYGSDLDNLLKRFMDALNETIFSDAAGKDSCILSITASKAKVNDKKQAGALLEVLPVSVA